MSDETEQIHILPDIFVRIKRPEGYEDVHQDILLSDFKETPIFFNVEIVDILPVLRALESIERAYATHGERMAHQDVALKALTPIAYLLEENSDE